MFCSPRSWPPWARPAAASPPNAHHSPTELAEISARTRSTRPDRARMFYSPRSCPPPACCAATSAPNGRHSRTELAEIGARPRSTRPDRARMFCSRRSCPPRRARRPHQLSARLPLAGISPLIDQTPRMSGGQSTLWSWTWSRTASRSSTIQRASSAPSSAPCTGENRMGEGSSGCARTIDRAHS